MLFLLAVVQVDLIGPYTIKGLDQTCLDFMCMAMIDPATGWFEVAELPTVEVFRKSKRKDENGATVEVEVADEIFDKTSAQISRLFNRTGTEMKQTSSLRLRTPCACYDDDGCDDLVAPLQHI